MKRIAKAVAGTTLALSLFAGSAAMAAPAHYGDRDRGSNNGAAIAAGIGLIALTAILASQNDRGGHVAVYGDDDRGYGRGYDRSYDRGYRKHWRQRDQRGYRFNRDRRW